MDTKEPAPDFKHPYVAIDVVLLSAVNEQICVLLVERETPHLAGWGLPGAYLQYDERIAACRDRILRDKCAGVPVEADFRPLTPRDEPDRDQRRRTISLVSWAPVPAAVVTEINTQGVRLAPIARVDGEFVVLDEDEAPSPLAVDHLRMVADAVDGLTAEVDHLAPAAGAVPDLSPSPFTMRDVESVLSAVADLYGERRPDTNALRRRLGLVSVGTGVVEELGPGQRHRPAELREWS